MFTWFSQFIFDHPKSALLYCNHIASFQPTWGSFMSNNDIPVKLPLSLSPFDHWWPQMVFSHNQSIVDMGIHMPRSPLLGYHVAKQHCVFTLLVHCPSHQKHVSHVQWLSATLTVTPYMKCTYPAIGTFIKYPPLWASYIWPLLTPFDLCTPQTTDLQCSIQNTHMPQLNFLKIIFLELSFSQAPLPLHTYSTLLS